MRLATLWILVIVLMETGPTVGRMIFHWKGFEEEILKQQKGLQKNPRTEDVVFDRTPTRALDTFLSDSSSEQWKRLLKQYLRTLDKDGSRKPGKRTLHLSFMRGRGRLTTGRLALGQKLKLWI